MTDPQLSNNNNNNNNTTNNNDGEPKYLHKKFKKMASTEVTVPRVEVAPPVAPEGVVAERREDCKEKTDCGGETDGPKKNGHVCPHCNLSCAKPSVLQKHIRAHTNERPYPCKPCGFAFKTKSNLYKHCRSRAHALKLEGGDVGKISEDSDMSFSDSASTGTGTSPPLTPTSVALSVSGATPGKSVKSVKIYKPKFHTALQCTSSNDDADTSSVSQAKQLHEHIDKLITHNRAIVEDVDPRLHKLMQQRQQNEVRIAPDQPLNLTAEETTANSSKRLFPENGHSRSDAKEDDTFICSNCRISYSSADNLEAHKRYYCISSTSPRKTEFRLDLDQKDPELDGFGELRPLPSPGPLLGNTRLVDAYVVPAKKSRNDTSMATTLRSLEELSKYPRPNALQMFGGEVRILDTTGEMKTMRIEPRPSSSPGVEEAEGAETTASIMVRSSLHSGGTMVHKPPAPVQVKDLAPSISLAPIVPNISTPSIAPAMSCYSYLNPLSNITAYNPLTLPQAEVAKIMHDGKVIPYVPGMPGPHTLSESPPVDLQPAVFPADPIYKVIPGIPGLHLIQPLDLANTPNPSLPLDLASPVKDIIIPKPLSPQEKLRHSPDDRGRVLRKRPWSYVEEDNSEPDTDESIKFPATSEDDERAAKFLRPSSLPLKPGTFVPKRHHGITPTANTLQLISPETPRPKKSYGQLYLNGHAYTYLGLKCSTRLMYCTLNRPQPIYVKYYKGLSMYSNWQIHQDGGAPDPDMSYDSRYRTGGYSVAGAKCDNILTPSSGNPLTSSSSENGAEGEGQEKVKRVKIFDGGFESNEDYTYVRGRGRGRYVCEECGIRCKKPSMLKKHIRTHKDVRPYTCKHCSFSFKTKGNLTKHMKSKAHYKKCVELGILPVPTSVCDENIDKEAIAGLVAVGGSAEQSDSDSEESENDDSDESGSEEQEAAQSLLSLSQISGNNAIAGILRLPRPSTYPYYLSTSTSVTTTSVVSENAINVLSGGCISSSTVIQSEFSNRYYFPSNRSVQEVEREPATESRAQPMDLTIKQAGASKPKPVDILTPVSEPVMLQTMMQSMERLPIQGSMEWKSEVEDGHMLQAYLTERHVMDSKIKQQYRVGNLQPNKDPYSSHPIPAPSNDLNSVPTVTYTNRTKFHHDQSFETKLQQTLEDSKLEAREASFSRVGALDFKYSFGERPSFPEPESSQKPTTIAQVKTIVTEHPPVVRAHDQGTWKLAQQRPKVPELTPNDLVYEFRDTPRNLELIPPQRKVVETGKEPETAKMLHPIVRKIVGCGGGFITSSGASNGLKNNNRKPQAIVKPQFLQNSGSAGGNYGREDGKNVCGICNKVFSKSSQLKLHINIHYFERPFKCESCGISFMTKGHLTKHERSGSHHNKVSKTSTFGTPTASNPRPFKCQDCLVAFRIHGHLAKHLRSKMHIMRLECLGKLPFGIYAEMERSSINLNDIDTTDCDNSLTSLQILAQQLYKKDPTKLGPWDSDMAKNQSAVSGGETSSDEGEPVHLRQQQHSQSQQHSRQQQILASDGAIYRPYITPVATEDGKSKKDAPQVNGETSDVLIIKCQACGLNFNGVNELHAHNSVVHGADSNKENNTLRQDKRGDI